jgi:hypothetical protein
MKQVYKILIGRPNVWYDSLPEPKRLLYFFVLFVLFIFGTFWMPLGWKVAIISAVILWRMAGAFNKFL